MMPANTRLSFPSVQYVTPREGCSPSIPESNFQRSLPEAASREITLSEGVNV